MSFCLISFLQSQLQSSLTAVVKSYIMHHAWHVYFSRSKCKHFQISTPTCSSAVATHFSKRVCEDSTLELCQVSSPSSPPFCFFQAISGKSMNFILFQLLSQSLLRTPCSSWPTEQHKGWFPGWLGFKKKSLVSLATVSQVALKHC